jgi:hypothetical protein
MLVFGRHHHAPGRAPNRGAGIERFLALVLAAWVGMAGPSSAQETSKVEKFTDTVGFLRGMAGLAVICAQHPNFIAETALAWYRRSIALEDLVQRYADNFLPVDEAGLP